MSASDSHVQAEIQMWYECCWSEERIRTLRDPQYRFFALANAVQYGHLEIVRELLNHGADTMMEVWDFKENALTGKTSSLVDVAIQNGYPEIAKLLDESINRRAEKYRGRPWGHPKPGRHRAQTPGPSKIA